MIRLIKDIAQLMSLFFVIYLILFLPAMAALRIAQWLFP